MIKWKTLIALVGIFVSGLSQDNDEWSQEYDDYAGELDEIFKVPVDEEYDDLIKKIKETRDNDFEPEDNDGLIEFGDMNNEVNSDDNGGELEFNYEFYDNLVNDNGEIFNDGLQELSSPEEPENIIGIENKEDGLEKYYGQNINEDTVKDENINGNAPLNEYDPEELNKDGKFPHSDSKEETLQHENGAEHNPEVQNEQGGHQISIPANIIEEATAQLEQDTENSDYRSNKLKPASVDNNAEQRDYIIPSNIYADITTKFEENKLGDKFRNQNSFECENCNDTKEEGKNYKSNESKISYLNDRKETDYKIKGNFEPDEKYIFQSENESGDWGTNKDPNEVGHIENVHDDYEEMKKMNEIMEIICYDDSDEELVGIDDDGKSYEHFNGSDISENEHIDNNVIRAGNIGNDDHDQASEDSDADTAVINDSFKHDDNGTVADRNYIHNLGFNDQNDQRDSNHVIADCNDRNKLRGIHDTVADSSMYIDESISNEDDEIDAEKIYADEKLLIDVENLENSDDKQSWKAKSNNASDYDTKEYAQNQFRSDDDSADEIKENYVDDAKGESKISIEDLNIEIEKFIDEHNVEISYDLKTLDVSPINVNLNFDKAVTISSPNYPEPYTGNTVTDWYFDGESGTGIELNITNFSVDGNSGDYLLLKPGQIDTSSSNGIIFTYMLKQERRYRFMDVDNMFVRFESKGSNSQKFKGFLFSVKFIEPKKDLIVEPDPEPEEVVKAPIQTHTVHLAGLTLHETDKVEAFKEILVKMAAMYINAKWPQYLQPSLSKAVQLTRLTSCNVAWPHTDGCASVTFGISLPDDDCCDDYRLTTKQMTEMWTTYSVMDPFATRMIILGISEYDTPDDRAILTVWWALTFGAVLLVCVVVFTVRHLGCLHDYNGMSRLHEETDSVKSGRKSDLSLYPTPHQTLPPMFADGKFDHYLDGDYAPDNTTRVDLSGASNNKGFARDGELMDLDSDEEIIMSLPDEAKPNTRSSYSSGIRPRDVYEV